MNEFLNAIETLSKKVEQTVDERTLTAEAPNAKEGKEVNVSWDEVVPEGLQKRAAAHFEQMSKRTTAFVRLFEVEVRTTYETVTVGLAVIRWEQIWGDRVGYGYTPYVRYETSCGNVFNYTSLDELAQDEDRFFDQERYFKRLRQDADEELRAVFAAHSEIDSRVIGWINTRRDEDADRYVWSQNEAATKTIRAALRALKEQDLFGGGFWTERVELYASLG